MKDYFLLAVRIVGLLAALDGMRYLLTFVFILLAGDADSFILFYFLTIALFELIVGGYLLRGAPLIVEYAFRRDQSVSDYRADE